MGISTAGHDHILLMYDWPATHSTERDDHLVVQWREQGHALWNTAIQLRFYTSVSTCDEAVYLDEVKVIGNGGRPVPEPTAVALFDVGAVLVSRAIRRRR